MPICHYYTAAVPDLPGLAPDRPDCSAQCRDAAVLERHRDLIREITA